MEKSIKKAVVDTNIFISVFVFPSGVIREIISLAITNKVELIVSVEILEEFSCVLREKFGWTENMVIEKMHVIKSLVKICDPDIKIDAVHADKTDNKIIECAVFAGADVIISGDKHLLDMKKYHNIRILKPADFLRMIIG